MDVCIVHTIERKERGWQVMKRISYGFNHVFPGVLFTLDEARRQGNVVLWEEEKPGEWWAVYCEDLII